MRTRHRQKPQACIPDAQGSARTIAFASSTRKPTAGVRKSAQMSRGSHDGRSGKRLKPHDPVNIARVHSHRSLAAAAGTARRLPQSIVRRIRSPSDDERDESHRRFMCAIVLPAIDPEPGRGAAQLGKRRHRRRRFACLSLRCIVVRVWTEAHASIESAARLKSKQQVPLFTGCAPRGKDFVVKLYPFSRHQLARRAEVRAAFRDVGSGRRSFLHLRLPRAARRYPMLSKSS